MTTQQIDEQRLIDLETRAAFQEHTIQELNEVIYRQQQQLDRLEQLFAIMLQKVRDQSDSGDSPQDEKPPHY